MYYGVNCPLNILQFFFFFLNDNYLSTNDYQSISSSHSTTKLHIYKKFDFFNFFTIYQNYLAALLKIGCHRIMISGSDDVF